MGSGGQRQGVLRAEHSSPPAQARRFALDLSPGCAESPRRAWAIPAVGNSLPSSAADWLGCFTTTSL